MNTLRWGLWLRTADESKALKLAHRAVDLLKIIPSGVRVTGLGESGPDVRFETPLRAETRAERLVEAIVIAQRLGDEWTLRGDVERNPCASCTETRISGVVVAEWELELD